LLRTGAATPGLLPAVPVEDEDGVEEGRLLFRAHRSRERDRGLVARKKQAAMSAHGTLGCEVCGFDFASTYGELGKGFAEVHHAVPLSQSGLTKTRLADLVVLCSNCHRMAHRGQPWPSVEDLRGILR
jgi:5-methylcytosine-specific restriction enzyme A